MDPLPPPDGVDSYSPSATVVTFDLPVPLLRVPIPAGFSDDPSVGPLVLAFPDAKAFSSALTACESKTNEQCNRNARFGCSVAASLKCSRPWWRAVFGGGGGAEELKARQECEARELAIFVASTAEKCRDFAKSKCLSAFRDARIALDHRSKMASRMISCASMAEDTAWFSLVGVDRRWVLRNCEVAVTNYRGSAIIDHPTSEAKNDGAF